MDITSIDGQDTLSAKKYSVDRLPGTVEHVHVYGDKAYVISGDRKIHEYKRSALSLKYQASDNELVFNSSTLFSSCGTYVYMLENGILYVIDVVTMESEESIAIDMKAVLGTDKNNKLLSFSFVPPIACFLTNYELILYHVKESAVTVRIGLVLTSHPFDCYLVGKMPVCLNNGNMLFLSEDMRKALALKIDVRNILGLSFVTQNEVTLFSDSEIYSLTLPEEVLLSGIRQLGLRISPEAWFSGDDALSILSMMLSISSIREIAKTVTPGDQATLFNSIDDIMLMLSLNDNMLAKDYFDELKDAVHLSLKKAALLSEDRERLLSEIQALGSSKYLGESDRKECQKAYEVLESYDKQGYETNEGAAFQDTLKKIVRWKDIEKNHSAFHQGAKDVTKSWKSSHETMKMPYSPLSALHDEALSILDEFDSGNLGFSYFQNKMGDLYDRYADYQLLAEEVYASEVFNQYEELACAAGKTGDRTIALQEDVTSLFRSASPETRADDLLAALGEILATHKLRIQEVNELDADRELFKAEYAAAIARLQDAQTRCNSDSRWDMPSPEGFIACYRTVYDEILDSFSRVRADVLLDDIDVLAEKYVSYGELRQHIESMKDLSTKISCFVPPNHEIVGKAESIILESENRLKAWMEEADESENPAETLSANLSQIAAYHEHIASAMAYYNESASLLAMLEAFIQKYSFSTVAMPEDHTTVLETYKSEIVLSDEIKAAKLTTNVDNVIEEKKRKIRDIATININAAKRAKERGTNVGLYLNNLIAINDFLIEHGISTTESIPALISSSDKYISCPRCKRFIEKGKQCTHCHTPSVSTGESKMSLESIVSDFISSKPFVSWKEHCPDYSKRLFLSVANGLSMRDDTLYIEKGEDIVLYNEYSLFEMITEMMGSRKELRRTDLIPSLPLNDYKRLMENYVAANGDIFRYANGVLKKHDAPTPPKPTDQDDSPLHPVTQVERTLNDWGSVSHIAIGLSKDELKTIYEELRPRMNIQYIESGIIIKK